MDNKITRLKVERKNAKTEMQNLSSEVKKTLRKKRELDKVLHRFGQQEILVAIAGNVN
jgi:hypothetical protein